MTVTPIDISTIWNSISVWLMNFISLPVDQMMLKMFFTVGWIPYAVVFLYGVKEIWIDYRNGLYASKQKFILLAIDIPRDNTQSPRAVENIFEYLAGMHGSANLIEKWWDGKFQLSISLEIVSIDGYTQFLVHAPAAHRDNIESAFYAQYPEAEISEVNDYTEVVPHNFPDDEYDLWGTEFHYSKDWAYPIKTYESFMHQMGKPEEHFKDPMASLMDLCSSLKKGEQIWWQNIITPQGFDWMGHCDDEINNILGKKAAPKDHIVDKLIKWIVAKLSDFSEFVMPMWGDIKDSDDDSADTGKSMMELNPVEKIRIEAVTNKKSKTAYAFKSRFIYLANKEVMNKPKVVNGFVGYMKQFTDLNLNNLKPEIPKTGTSAAYFFVERRLNARKNKLMSNYRGRSSSSGMTPGIMNIEELASIWHFPIESVVKAPLIQKASGRKSEPPSSLPFDTGDSDAEISSISGDDEDIFSNLGDEVSGSGFGDNELVNNNQAGGKKEGAEENIFESSASDNDRDKGTPPSNLPFA